MKPLSRIITVAMIVTVLSMISNRAVAEAKTIILQYKYTASYTNPDGAQKAGGYVLVETDDSGTYDPGNIPVLFIVDKKNKTFEYGNWPLIFNHSAVSNKVTAHTDFDAYPHPALLWGVSKAVTLSGRYGGFTPFSFTLQSVAPSMTGQELKFTNTGSWYVTKNSKLKLDKSRTKHYMEEGDDTMNEVVAHLIRWLEDKGYRDLTS